jgi:hypothetical protein
MKNCEKIICLVPTNRRAPSIEDLRRSYFTEHIDGAVTETPEAGGKCLGSPSETIQFVKERIETSAPEVMESGIEGDDIMVELQIDFRDIDNYFERVTIRACNHLLNDFLAVVMSLKMGLHILMSEIVPLCLLPNLGDSLARNPYLKSLLVIDIQLRYPPQTAFFPMVCTVLKHTRTVQRLQLIKEWPLPSADNRDLEEWNKALEMNNSLEYIDLSHNTFTLPSFERLSLSLSQKTRLKELRLLDCNIQDKQLDCIGHVLPRMKGLVLLEISWNGPFGSDGSSLSNFGQAISKLPCLERLNLSRCNIVSKNLALFTLHLPHLPQMKPLKVLDLSDNYNIDSTALRDLNEATYKSSTLQTLNWGNCKILNARKSMLFKSLEHSLKRNRPIVRLFTREPPSLSLWPLVLERFAKDADILFYCLGETVQFLQS